MLCCHRASWESGLLRVLTPPLPQAEGSSPVATSLILLIYPCTCGGSCVSSHQWVVPLSLPWIGIMGHPVYLPWSQNALFLERGLIFNRPFVLLSAKKAGKNTCRYFFRFQYETLQAVLCIGHMSVCPSPGCRIHLWKFSELSSTSRSVWRALCKSHSPHPHTQVHIPPLHLCLPYSALMLQIPITGHMYFIHK